MTMKFSQAQKVMEKGESIYRTDWGFDLNTRICLIKFNGIFQFYMLGAIRVKGKDLLEGYGLTYIDINSDKWSLWKK